MAKYRVEARIVRYLEADSEEEATQEMLQEIPPTCEVVDLEAQEQ